MGSRERPLKPVHKSWYPAVPGSKSSLLESEPCSYRTRLTCQESKLLLAHRKRRIGKRTTHGCGRLSIGLSHLPKHLSTHAFESISGAHMGVAFAIPCVRYRKEARKRWRGRHYKEISIGWCRYCGMRQKFKQKKFNAAQSEHDLRVGSSRGCGVKQGPRCSAAWVDKVVTP